MQTFTHDWFSQNIKFWEILLQTKQPRKILEVGAFEGLSTCFIIDYCSQFSPIELHVIDSWLGGEEHTGIDMTAVERNFHSNVNHSLRQCVYPVKLHKRKGNSYNELAKLVVEGVRDFDMIYIDGSHKPADVLTDAVMAFPLLKTGGLMIFDDYRAVEKQDLLKHPRFGIDAFYNVFADQINLITFNDEEKIIQQDQIYQLYIEKK